jgi:hypothetical protein
VPPSIQNSWPHFAFLIVTAIVMYLAKWPILLISAPIGFLPRPDLAVPAFLVDDVCHPGNRQRAAIKRAAG